MSQRQAYLDALGITAWERRPAPGTDLSTNPACPPEPEAKPEARPEAMPDTRVKPPGPAPSARPPATKALGFELGPGQGSCLFLCSSEDDTATPLAADLARLLEQPPVWARTAMAGGGMDLETAVAERLFTRVVIFGQAQALLALGGAAPKACGAAQVVVAPELKRLAVDPQARRSCWETFRALGIGRRG